MQRFFYEFRLNKKGFFPCGKLANGPIDNWILTTNGPQNLLNDKLYSPITISGLPKLISINRWSKH
jgi:hypothetical protein